MASGTDGVRAGEHGSGRRSDGMVRMTDNTPTAATEGVKRLFVRAFLKALRIEHVAVPADGRNRFHLGRLGSMIAMTGRARRRRQISPLGQGSPLAAGSVFVELTCRDVVRCHPGAICMALGAGLCNAQ